MLINICSKLCGFPVFIQFTFQENTELFLDMLFKVGINISSIFCYILDLFIYMCINVCLPACMYVNHMHALPSEVRGWFEPPGTEVTDGPIQEQQGS